MGTWKAREWQLAQLVTARGCESVTFYFQLEFLHINQFLSHSLKINWRWTCIFNSVLKCNVWDRNGCHGQAAGSGKVQSGKGYHGSLVTFKHLLWPSRKSPHPQLHLTYYFTSIWKKTKKVFILFIRISDTYFNLCKRKNKLCTTLSLLYYLTWIVTDMLMSCDCQEIIFF